VTARWVVVLLSAVALPAAASAQGLGLGGFADVYNVQRRLLYAGTVYEQTGVWYGAAGSLRLGAVRVGVSGLTGTVSGGGSQSPNVQIRSTAVTVQVALAPWVLVGVQAEARRFDADAGVTLWRMIGGNVRVEPGLGLAGLQGFADVSVLPASSVSGGGPSFTMAMQATIGVNYALARSPLVFRLGYRFERYDIASTAGAAARYEQYRGIIAGAGIHLGR